MENKKQKFKPKQRTIKTEYKCFNENELEKLLNLKKELEKNEQRNDKAK